MMYKELKEAILNWLLTHEHTFNRTNACVAAFRPYIYDAEGNHLIGGETVYNFIKAAEDLLYPRKLP